VGVIVIEVTSVIAWESRYSLDVRRFHRKNIEAEEEKEDELD